MLDSPLPLADAALDSLEAAADRLKLFRNSPAKPWPGRQEMIDCLDMISELARILNDRLNGPAEAPSPEPEPGEDGRRGGYL